MEFDAMATAYRTGQFGLQIDTAEGVRWQARADQLRQQRAAAARRTSTTGKK